MYLAKNPDAWAQAQPDDTPPPAPIRLSISETRNGVDWCIGPTGEARAYAWGRQATRAAAEEAAQEKASILGLVRVHDGWCSPPDAGLAQGTRA